MEPIRFIHTKEGVRIGYRIQNEMGYSRVTIYLNCNLGEKFDIKFPNDDRVTHYFDNEPVTYERNKYGFRPKLYVHGMYLADFVQFMRNVKVEKYIDFEARPDKVASQLLTILN